MEVKTLYSDSRDHRERRDQTNEKVKEIKNKRDDIHNVAKETSGKPSKKQQRDGRSLHKEMEVLATTSQQAHENMLDVVKQAKLTRNEADGYNEKVKDLNSTIRKIRKEIRKLTKELEISS